MAYNQTYVDSIDYIRGLSVAHCAADHEISLL